MSNSASDGINRSIFDDNFWVASTIIVVMALIVGGITLDTYLDNKIDLTRMEKGYEECVVSFPNGKATMAWKKNCPSEVRVK